MILLPNCGCCACSDECCRQRVYGYFDTVPPGKWYDECPDVGNCQPPESGGIVGSCAEDILDGFIIERFCKASLGNKEIHAILRNGSALDDYGEIAGIETTFQCGALGRIEGDHDITEELEFEDDGAYIIAKVPFIARNNPRLGGPYGAAWVSICWCCIDPEDPPPEGEICPCCGTIDPPPPPSPCSPCGEVDDPPTSAGTYTNYQTDPCRNMTFADYTLSCGPATYAHLTLGAFIAVNLPDFGIPEELLNCTFLLLVTHCTTTDFAVGQDTESNCCTVSTYTSIYRYYAYLWNKEDCLWRLWSQLKYVEVIQNGDPLAIGGCDAAFPPSRQCNEICPQSYDAEACCNPFA
jgi:hypothetical protein